MKIRITDLMDNYFDDSIRLIPPEQLESGSGPSRNEAPDSLPRGGRLHKGLLIAASILLVLCAAAGLTLGIFQQNSSPAPVALAEGEASAYSTEEPETSEEAEQETPSSELENAVSPYLMEMLDTTLLSFTQRGDQLEFLFTLSPLTQETYERLQEKGFDMRLCQPENAFAPNPPEEISDPYTLEATYNSEDQSLHVYGTITLSPSALSFVPVIQESTEEPDANDHYFCGTQLTLTAFEPDIFPETDWTPFDINAFAQYEPNGLVAFPSPVSEESSCIIDTVIVTADRVSLFGTVVTASDPLRGTIWDIWPMDAIAQSGISLELLSLDSTIEFSSWESPIDFRFVKAGGENESLWYLFASFEQETIDPAAIVSAAFQLREDAFEEEETEEIAADELPLSSGDTDGDGLLTAEINLSFPHMGIEGSYNDTILRLVIDPEAGTYTWYTRLFGEDPEAVNSGIYGDISTILAHEQTAELFTATENYLLENYYRNAYLVFTDGTRVVVGSGDKISHDTEARTFSEESPMDALFEDENANPLDIDWRSLTLDHLELCGESYYFE